MTELLRDDEGDIRVMGSPAFIQAVIERLSGVLDVSYDGNLRPNRHGDGHRAHAHIRLTNPTSPAADDAALPR